MLLGVCDAAAKRIPGSGRGAGYVPYVVPSRLVDLPPEIASMAGQSMLSSAVADTFHLAWYDWDDGTSQGWTRIDLGEQRGTFFHIADASELDGGSFGALVPLEGNQSLWCGAVLLI